MQNARISYNNFFLEKYYLEQNERPDKELVIAYAIQLITHTLPTRLH